MPPMKKIWSLCPFPLIVSIFAVLFTNAAGPYWLAYNNDPAYFYFFNSLYLLDGLPLYPTTHPGLTLDVLGSLTYKFFHPVLSHQDLFLAVVKDPEFYLHAMHYLMVFMYVISLVALGWYAYKKSKDIFFSLLVQSSSLLVLAVPANNGDTILPVMAHVKPETLLVTAVNLLMIGLLKLYWDKNMPSRVPIALYLGCVCALGVFTKYTFILSLALVLFLLRGFAGRCWFLLGFLIVGFIFYNVETDPYHRILVWVKDLVFKSGFTGQMTGKFIEPAEFFPALKALIIQNFFVFLISCLALFVGVLKRDKFLFLISGCVLVQFLMVAKHTNPHYMVPAVGLSGLVMALFYHQFRENIPPRIGGLSIIIFTLFSMGWLGYYAQHLSAKNHAMERYSESLKAKYQDFVICPFYQSSSLVFTLACYTNDMNTYYNKLLYKLYPDYYYYDTNARDFKDFLSTWVPLSKIEAGHKGVLLYGNDMPENIFRPSTLVHKIDHTPQGEALYFVQSQQSPHAGEFLQYSMMLYAQGQYLPALQYGVYAKQLGLPGDIGGYLNQVAARISQMQPNK